MNRKPIYIASPYAGEVERNVSFAIRCCRYAIQQGETPIVPHLLYPQILDDRDPAERRIGLALGHRLLESCGEMWVCGARISHGMEGEISLAKKLGLPIRYVDEWQITSALRHEPVEPAGPELSFRRFAAPERMLQIANNAIDSFGELLNGRSLYEALSGSLKMDDAEILAAGFTTLKEFMGGANDVEKEIQ